MARRGPNLKWFVAPQRRRIKGETWPPVLRVDDRRRTRDDGNGYGGSGTRRRQRTRRGEPRSGTELVPVRGGYGYGDSGAREEREGMTDGTRT